MGCEIAGGLGAKMADPAREVYVLMGDGCCPMMAQEIVTSLEEQTDMIETSYEETVPGCQCWWDLPVAEVSNRDSVNTAWRNYEDARKNERLLF